MQDHVADLLFAPLNKLIHGANNENENKRILWWLQPSMCHNALNEGVMNVRKNRFWKCAIGDRTNDELIKYIARNQKKIYAHEKFWKELFEYHQKGVFGKFLHNIRDSNMKDGWDVGSVVNPGIALIGAVVAGGYNVYKQNKDKADGIGIYCSYFNDWNSSMREEYHRSLLPLVNADYEREVILRKAKQRWFLVHLLVGIAVVTCVWIIGSLFYEYFARWGGSEDFLSKSIFMDRITFKTWLTYSLSIIAAFVYFYRLRYNSIILKSILFIMTIIVFILFNQEFSIIG